MLHKNKLGFSLIETLIALMIFALTGGVVAVVMTQVMSVVNSAKLNSQGTFYAQQGIETMRDFYQTNLWLALAGKDTNQADGSATCYLRITDNSSSPCSVVMNGTNFLIFNNQFYRQLKVTYSSSPTSQVKAESLVMWKDKGKTNSTTVTTIFYNY